MRNFRDLVVWERAHTFTLAIYRITKNFPREERYGLTAQLRDASSSIPSNIAEGCGRRSNREFVRFLDIASGSGSEADYRLLLARDLGYVQEPVYQELLSILTEVRRMLTALIKRFRED